MTAELRLTPNSFPVFGLFYVLLPFFSINVEKKYLSGKVTFLFQSTFFFYLSSAGARVECRKGQANKNIASIKMSFRGEGGGGGGGKKEKKKKGVNYLLRVEIAFYGYSNRVFRKNRGCACAADNQNVALFYFKYTKEEKEERDTQKTCLIKLSN